MTITCMETEPALVTDEYKVPFNPPNDHFKTPEDECCGVTCSHTVMLTLLEPHALWSVNAMQSVTSVL